MEQLVILLIIGAVSLIKWLMEKSAEARERAKAESRHEETEATPWEAPRPIAAPPPYDRTEDAKRRLREALGLPDEEGDFAPRSEEPEAIPPRPVILFEHPLPESLVADDREQRFMPEPTPVLPPLPAVSAAKPSASDWTRPAYDGLDDLLRSREGLRRAILVQEILGPPKGLVF